MNIGKALLHMFPNADPMKDYRVQDDSDGSGPYIAKWEVKDEDGNAVPQPTEAELQAAWDDLQAHPPVKPKTETELLQEQNTEQQQVIDDLTLALADMYANDTSAAQQQQIDDLTLALADLYANGGVI